MLEVVGAGATAVAKQNWYEVWLNASECKQLHADLEHIHTEGRKQPPVGSTLHGAYATPWLFQTKTLLRRQYASYWRNPTYLMSKLTLNIIGGLFIGFTFFKSGSSIQANQDKLFVSSTTCKFGTVFILSGNLYGHSPGMSTISTVPQSNTNLTLFKSAPLGGQVHVPYINVCTPQERMFPMILTAT